MRTIKQLTGKEIFDKMELIMKEKNINVTMIAQRMDTPISYVSKLRHRLVNNGDVLLSTLRDLAQALDTEVQTLISE